MPFSSRNVKESPQVFINFRGEELRNTFISHLEDALKRNGINVYIDSDELAGENLNKLFERIEESNVALAILSCKYTESKWCLKELVKIMECEEKDNLWVIPIYFNLDPRTVRGLDGVFGVQMWNLWREEGRNRKDQIAHWNAALQGVADKFCLVSETNKCGEADFIKKIITHVQNALSEREPQRRGTKHGKFLLLLLAIFICYLAKDNKI